MYQGTKNSFALPVELTAKFFGLQYRNRTDDIKIIFIVAASALFICFDKANYLTYRGIFVHHPRLILFTHRYESVPTAGRVRFLLVPQYFAGGPLGYARFCHDWPCLYKPLGVR